MDWYWIFGMMLFCHVIEDFHIQGILANMKQRVWWLHNIQDAVKDSEKRHGNEITNMDDSSISSFINMRMRQYGKDYIPCLLAHGFEWSAFVHIPILWFYGFEPIIFASIIINALVHSYIDDMKCNKMMINLIQDQILHIIQIAVSSAIMVAVL